MGTLSPYVSVTNSLFLLQLFVRRRALIIEDQMLRAMGTGFDRLSNPHALWLRRSYGRAYYQASSRRQRVLNSGVGVLTLRRTPRLCSSNPRTITGPSSLSLASSEVRWVDWTARHFQLTLIILARFTVSTVALIFRLNSSLQLAMVVLVLFLAYAAQVRLRQHGVGRHHFPVAAPSFRFPGASQSVHVPQRHPACHRRARTPCPGRGRSARAPRRPAGRRRREGAQDRGSLGVKLCRNLSRRAPLRRRPRWGGLDCALQLQYR